MFCWHDWVVFKRPDKSLYVSKKKTKYRYRYWHAGISLGATDDIQSVSDLVCSKCSKMKLNLTNRVNKHRAKLGKGAKAVAKKQKEIDAQREKKIRLIERREYAIKGARKKMEETNEQN